MSIETLDADAAAHSLAHALMTSLSTATPLSHLLLSHTLRDLQVARGEAREEERWRRRAHLHDNGFLKLVLVGETEWSDPKLSGHKLVLHIWDHSTRSNAEANVHNHRWRFWSLLLRGALRWDHFAPSELEAAVRAQYVRHTYSSPGHGPNYSFDRCERATLDWRFGAVVPAGTFMSLGVDELHRVLWMGNNLAASLVLQGRPERLETHVYSPVHLPHASLDGKRPVRPATFADIYRLVEFLATSDPA